MPYQDAPDPPVGEALRARCAEAMHVLTADGRTLLGDQAVIHVYEQVGFGAARWLRVAPLRWVTPSLYRLVARNRRAFAPWFFRRSD